MQSEFWLMSKTAAAETATDYPGSSLPKASIVELTPDGISFLWPIIPFISHEYLQEIQDPDYAVDGEWLSENGYYHNFEDFKKMNDFPAQFIHFMSLGQFESIRAAREFLRHLKTVI